ncbi:cellular tumor antigen p53 [Drosophila madeirensis]|uniref:Cellular tumor antigen p53 n=1 Tax=Drosophila madeirensis TaxID=30013 RepID=A0AAU9F825_DROMD
MYIVSAMSWHKVSEDFNADTAENSVGSTDSNGEDGPIIEEPIEATDLTTEPMAFLQGLNSGNLMQFSQQSVLREMMLQDFQNQSNSLPKLESHNIGGYNFSMVLKEPPKSHWVYSHITNKLYIRMDKTFNIDVQFKPLMPIQPLNLRVFLCFNKDVSGPVLRCQNHLSTEPVTNQNQKMRESLVRCENPSTTYCGSAQGKGISERYSVLVPLNLSPSSSRNGGYVRQTLAFKFVCQNSCLGRKETSLLFCLENSSGDILAQYVMSVKISTCPKRDCTQDERHATVRKRKSLASSDIEEDADVKPAKARRRTVSYKRDVKDETESNDSHDTEQSLPIDWQVSRTPDGEYRLAITCPKKEWLLQNIEGMIKESAAQVLRSPTKPHLRSYAHNLLELKKRAFDLP